MAEQGRPLEDLTSTTVLGVTVPFPEETFGEIEIFLDKINEINLVNSDQALINDLEKLIKEKCISKESMKDIFTNLHKAALANSDFGLKLIIGMKNIICYEIEEVKLRNILLNLIQEDFASKETLPLDKLSNAVMFLGYFYNEIEVGGAPIKVLGIALLEYFDLLLLRSPDDLKVLFHQIVINNANLLNDNSLSEKYKALQCNLRNALISGNLNEQSKWWILRSIEFMLGNLKPNDVEVLEDLYIKKLGNSYVTLKPMIAKYLATPKGKNVDNFSMEKKTFPNDKKTKSNLMSKSKDKMSKSIVGRTSDESSRKKNNISEKFSQLTVGKPENDHFKNRKGKMGGQQTYNKNLRRENKKWNSEGGYRFDHDDRFDKEENFYGTQSPRLPKHGNPKKNFNEDKKAEKRDGDNQGMNKSLNNSNENKEQTKEENWD